VGHHAERHRDEDRPGDEPRHATIPIGQQRVLSEISVAEGAVWIVNPTRRRLPLCGLTHDGGSVIRIDPRTNAVRTARLPGSSFPSWIVAAFGAVWVSDPGTKTITPIDPRTLRPSGPRIHVP
jgi:streptogramin lyase